MYYYIYIPIDVSKHLYSKYLASVFLKTTETFISYKVPKKNRPCKPYKGNKSFGTQSFYRKTIVFKLYRCLVS